MMKTRRRRSLTLMNIGAATFMLYAVAVSCPAQADFFRNLGASKIHFGLLGGIPLIVLCLQYVGALASSSIQNRKPFVVWITVLSRLLWLPIVLTPWCRNWLGDSAILACILGFIAASGALVNFEVPLYFSWVADLTPHRVLNRYWGVRQQWMNIASMSALLATAIFVGLSRQSSLATFPILVAMAVGIGMIEPILLNRTDEPPHRPARTTSWRASLLAPFRDTGYRSFLAFSCFWNFSLMMASPFLAIYALEYLQITVWQVTLLMSLQVAGGALISPLCGRLADRHGHRPILILSVALKSAGVITHMLVTPPWAALILAPILLLDGAMNACLLIASNGFMLKLAPRESRSAYIATIIGLSGLCGGIASTLSGLFLDKISAFSIVLFGRTWTHYHVLFLMSVILRLVTIPLACKIREPESSSHVDVLKDLTDARLFRGILRFPVGLYEYFTQAGPGEESRRKR